MSLFRLLGGLCALLLITALAQAAQEVPPKLRSIIEKSQSFGIGKYPISFWSYTSLNAHGKYMDEAEVAEWAECGFTVPQSPNFDPNKPEQVAQMRQLLDWADQYGMKLILSDPRAYARPELEAYKADLPSVVSLFKGHPALFGYHVGDEPGADMKEAFFSCQSALKEAAPEQFPYANLLPFFPGIEARAGTDTWPNYLDEYCQKAKPDLISYDCYTQMNPGTSGWQNYYENLRLYREAALRNGVPFWNTVLSVGHFNYRCPTLDDIRWQFNTTVASGAHGVLWFFYYMRAPHSNYRQAPIDEHWYRTPTWDALRLVHNNHHKFYGDLFTRLVCTKVMFSPEPFGGGQAFEPDGLIAEIGPSGSPDSPALLVSEFVDLEGRRYVMLVNNSQTANARASIKFRGADVRVFSYNWAGKEYEGGAYSADDQRREADGLTLYHWLAPGQEAFYRVESASADAELLPL